MRCSLFLGIPICLLLSSLLLKIVQFNFPQNRPLQKLFTLEELALYNGTDPQLPILLGILGSVFDVTKGKSHYGAGGGYNHFAGRDASRAFVSGNFTGDGLTDSVHGLSSAEVKSIVEWRDFYFRTYISLFLYICSVLIQRFIPEDSDHVSRSVSPIVVYLNVCCLEVVNNVYSRKGNPTKYLKGAEAKAARAAQLLEKQKKKEAQLPSCNSKWSQDEGSEVWCDDGYPRLVQRPEEIALTGKMSKRCGCFKEDELGQSGLEVYHGCDYFEMKCRI